MGVRAWVFSVQIQSGSILEAEIVQQLFESPHGLPVILEWCLLTPISLVEEQHAFEVLLPWLQHSSAHRQVNRPLLMIRGTHCFSHSQQLGQRLRSYYQRSYAGNPPWLMCPSQELLKDFDGSYEHSVLPSASEDSSLRLDYKQNLFDAHWHTPPQEWVIPAVRALTEIDRALYINGNAVNYCEWLRLMSYWADLSQEGNPSALLLLESWNGHRSWWTDAPKQTLASHVEHCSAFARELQWGNLSPNHLALFIHGFYLDNLNSILQSIDSRDVPLIDLYVSTPIHQLYAVASILRRQRWPRVYLVGVPNRGRDIAPLVIKLLPKALSVGHKAFIKVHTKKSPHLTNGQDWGDHLTKSLLDHDLIRSLENQLLHNADLALLAPAGTIVPITIQLQNNGRHLTTLQRRFHISGKELLLSSFVAGTMFAGRLNWLEPLCTIAPQFSCFEPESGQTDGTLAHAIERWVGVLALKKSLRMEQLPGDSSSLPDFGYGEYRSKIDNSMNNRMQVG